MGIRGGGGNGVEVLGSLGMTSGQKGKQQRKTKTQRGEGVLILDRAGKGK